MNNGSLKSPRDETKIMMNGKEVDRSSIPSLGTVPPPILRAASPEFEVVKNKSTTGTSAAAPAPTQSLPPPPPPPILSSTPQVQPVISPTPTRPSSSSNKTTSHASHTPHASHHTPHPSPIKGVNMKKEKKEKKTQVPQTPPPVVQSWPPPPPPFSKMRPDEIARFRADYKIKYSVLQHAYPNYGIHLPDDEMSPETIYDNFYRYIKQIHINNSMGNFRIGVLVLWCGMELVLTKMGLDASGFAKSRVQTINRYELLLIELGETYGVSYGNNWPIEVRLFMMTLTDLILFIILKYLSSFLGGPEALMNICNMLSGFIQSNDNGGIGAAIGATAQPSGASGNTASSASASTAMPPPMAGMSGFQGASAVLGNITNMLSGMMNANNTNNSNTGASANRTNPSSRRPPYKE